MVNKNKYALNASIAIFFDSLAKQDERIKATIDNTDMDNKIGKMESRIVSISSVSDNEQ